MIVKSDLIFYCNGIYFISSYEFLYNNFDVIRSLLVYKIDHEFPILAREMICTLIEFTLKPKYVGELFDCLQLKLIYHSPKLFFRKNHFNRYKKDKHHYFTHL